MIALIDDMGYIYHKRIAEGKEEYFNWERTCTMSEQIESQNSENQKE